MVAAVTPEDRRTQHPVPRRDRYHSGHADYCFSSGYAARMNGCRGELRVWPSMLSRGQSSRDHRPDARPHLRIAIASFWSAFRMAYTRIACVRSGVNPQNRSFDKQYGAVSSGEEYLPKNVTCC